MPNVLVLDPDRYDQGPNCLQKLLADDKNSWLALLIYVNQPGCVIGNVSDCISRGHEFDNNPVPYTLNNTYECTHINGLISPRILVRSYSIFQQIKTACE